MRWRKIPELARLKTGLWILLAGLLSVWGLLALRDYQQTARAQADFLPVTFAHSKHQGVNCASCHHEFIDDTGRGLCFDCHKTDPTVNASIEVQFHELCWGCHVEKQAAGEAHGPTRQCISCHAADNDP